VSEKKAPDPQQLTRQEELTADATKALVMLLRTAGHDITALTVAISFRVSDESATSHSATVAIHDTAARLHLETLSKSLVPQDVPEGKEAS
jgi:hypothetical protein